MADSVKKWIENGEQEIGVEVFFDYSPREPMTRNYPGCDEELSIYEVRLTNITDNNGRTIELRNDEICLLPDFQKLLEEEILDDRDEDINAAWSDYADYAYELRRDQRRLFR